MTRDDPLDLAQVAADDVALDQVRLSSVRPEDSALQLLRDLLSDVDRDLPVSAPVGRGSTVLRLANESTPSPKISRGATVAALLAAGVVTFSGVAAASTAVAPGNPLHGFGEGVRAAAGAVVDAVKPPDSPRRADPAAGTLPEAAADRASEAIASRPSAGPSVAAAARSTAAARQVEALLDEAEQLLADGRPTLAGQRLDLAERRLADVAAQDAAALRTRLGELRGRVVAASAPKRTGPGQPAAEPGPATGPRTQSKPAPQSEARSEPRTGPPAPDSARPGAAPDEAGKAGTARTAPAARTTAPRQSSRLASTKPRA